MSFPLNDLGTALTNQIYQTVMGGDAKVKPPANTFLTWCMPGLPFTAEDLDFCGKGLYSASTGEELNARLTHAHNLAMLLDFVPDPRAAFDSDRQEGMFKPDAEKRLSEMYRQILRFAKVVDDELQEKDKAKLQKFLGLLFTTKKVTDIITDEEKEVTEEGPLLKAYNEKMAAYVAAATEYNAKRAAAAAASGPEGKAAVADWSMNAQLYALKVKQAADAWASGGYRNDVDRMNAYINQVTQRSMVLWKQQLTEIYDKAEITGTDVAIPFRYTTLVPGNLATSGGWTTLTVNRETTEWAKSNKTTSWQVGGGIDWKIKAGGSGKGSKSTTTEDKQVTSFSLKFDLAQALIVRPWFYPEFFANRGWTLEPGDGWMFSDLPSDGGSPPKGEFIGYATQAIFVRNVEITSSDFVSEFKKAESSVEAKGKVGWGPLRLSGGMSKDRSSETLKTTVQGETLKVDGMQIVGFVNHLIGKAPNPLPELTDADFV